MEDEATDDPYGRVYETEANEEAHAMEPIENIDEEPGWNTVLERSESS